LIVEKQLVFCVLIRKYKKPHAIGSSTGSFGGSAKLAVRAIGSRYNT